MPLPTLLNFPVEVVASKIYDDIQRIKNDGNTTKRKKWSDEISIKVCKTQDRLCWFAEESVVSKIYNGLEKIAEDMEMYKIVVSKIQ